MLFSLGFFCNILSAVSTTNKIPLTPIVFGWWMTSQSQKKKASNDKIVATVTWPDTIEFNEKLCQWFEWTDLSTMARTCNLVTYFEKKTDCQHSALYFCVYCMCECTSCTSTWIKSFFRQKFNLGQHLKPKLVAFISIYQHIQVHVIQWIFTSSYWHSSTFTEASETYSAYRERSVTYFSMNSQLNIHAHRAPYVQCF